MMEITSVSQQSSQDFQSDVKSFLLIIFELQDFQSDAVLPIIATIKKDLIDKIEGP